MTDRFILSPRFIGNDSAAPGLLAGHAASVIVDEAPGPGDGIDRLAPIHQQVALAVEQSVHHAERPVAIVGDCCQVIPVMAGLERCGIKPALIWLDAHGDFNTWDTTPSKFIGGMPLAMLTGRGDQRLMQQVGLEPIGDARVVLSDGRDLDPGERALVQASDIAHVALDEVAAVLPAGPLYLHLDTDILDAAVAPAFLYPVTGGPSPETLRATLAAILLTNRVVAISICAAWDARRDGDGATLNAVRAAVAGLV